MSEIEQAIAQVKAKGPRCRLYEDYYDGRHRVAFAAEKLRSEFIRLFARFSDNLMPAVVNSVSDRLQVIGFGVQGRKEAQRGQERAHDAGDDAWDLWQANRLDRRAGQIHKEALKSGNGYMVVWPNAENQPIFYPQRDAFMAVGYDEETPGLMLWAAKVWRMQDGHWRVTLYYPDRIEKWVSIDTSDELPEKAASFKKYEVKGEAWPLANPWERVPVFHFANDADLGEGGCSELHNAIPIQDALNKSVLDMLVGMEFYALPQRWVAGLEYKEDPATGLPIMPWKAGVDKLFAIENHEAKFGQFDPGDPGNFIVVQDSLRMEMARITGTPLHYMMLLKDPPSGEALKTLETRNTKKVRDRMTDFGDVWEDAMTFALRMKKQDPESQIVTLWADPAPKGERERAETLGLLVNAGSALPGAAEVAGYTDAEAEKLGRSDLVGLVQ